MAGTHVSRSSPLAGAANGAGVVAVFKRNAGRTEFDGGVPPRCKKALAGVVVVVAKSSTGAVAVGPLSDVGGASSSRVASGSRD